MPEQRSRGFFVYSAWIVSILKFRSIRGVLILPQRREFAIDRLSTAASQTGDRELTTPSKAQRNQPAAIRIPPDQSRQTRFSLT
jgi:hypothetical protein